MDVARYLDRIGVTGPLAADHETLVRLQRAHLYAIPYENLSIGWDEPITLDVERHFAKIVERRRGGFCYEQNDLFAWALATIGFRVSLLAAGVWATRDGVAGFGDPFSHVVLEVAFDDGPWIADVGFGDNFRVPMPMVDGVVREEDGRAFRLDHDDDLWTLSLRDHQRQWAPSYRFADVERPIDAFAAMCRFHQTSPQSPFTKKRLCSLATPGGRITLSGDEWIETGLDGTRVARPIESEADAAQLLQDRFGIVMHRAWRVGHATPAT